MHSPDMIVLNENNRVAPRPSCCSDPKVLCRDCNESLNANQPTDNNLAAMSRWIASKIDAEKQMTLNESLLLPMPKLIENLDPPRGGPDGISQITEDEEKRYRLAEANLRRAIAATDAALRENEEKMFPDGPATNVRAGYATRSDSDFDRDDYLPPPVVNALDIQYLATIQAEVTTLRKGLGIPSDADVDPMSPVSRERHLLASEEDWDSARVSNNADDGGVLAPPRMIFEKESTQRTTVTNSIGPRMPTTL